MEFISISLPVHPAHLAAREGHLPCLQSLVLAHENVLTALDTRNDEVQYVLYMHVSTCTTWAGGEVCPFSIRIQ